ncbi:MAG: hypothetical protein CMJ50_10520 [Planctomycetaceae bacterium]|nr:hypothetical protein [Planctomycetaceae bacterium]
MQYRRLRAPHHHGQCVIDPPLSTAATLVAENQANTQIDTDLPGQSLHEIARTARHDLLSAARRYTAAYRDVPAVTMDEDAPLVMAGHQPSLFHPGVWFKNFVLDHLAKKLNAIAVNLLIDNDVSRQAAIRVPTGNVLAPRAVTVPYDKPQPGMPLEESRLLDPVLFAGFGDRICETVRPFSRNPLIAQLWPLAEQAAQRTNRVHHCLAEARHCIEHQWGLDTLELPLGEVCQQTAFRWFMSHILAHAQRFQVEHNDTLNEYRRANRVRSKTHPVPELAQQDNWLEAPFWIWTSDNPIRRPLFARPMGDQTDLSDLRGLTLQDVPLNPAGSDEAAVTYFAERERQGIKIRPRALMTTMFARLFLSDLFLHGIGGAKYDQLTDDLIQRFFGHPAPNFLVVTATAHLPIQRDPVHPNDLRELRQLARDFRFHPERYLEETRSTKPLIEEKQKWIHDDIASPRQRHEAISRLNNTLSGLLRKKQAQTAERSAHVAAALARERILGSREYSFCLFSQATLQPLLLDF